MSEFDLLVERLAVEWQKVRRIEHLNQELYDQLGGTINYILGYAKKSNIILPNEQTLNKMIDRASRLMDEINETTIGEQP